MLRTKIHKYFIDHLDFGINPDLGIHFLVFQNRGFTVFLKLDKIFKKFFPNLKSSFSLGNYEFWTSTNSVQLSIWSLGWDYLPAWHRSPRLDEMSKLYSLLIQNEVSFLKTKLYWKLLNIIFIPIWCIFEVHKLRWGPKKIIYRNYVGINTKYGMKKK